ncbi:MAG: hypothetical protein LQ343_005518 [Gyalolechia ehrenbergii]|nr:MAG: hypothetical protein LQ343_005518 [Gyalolechia ehrenbergii]
MGQASDFLFAPVSKVQTNKTGMADNEDMNIDEQPSVSAIEVQDTTSSYSTSSSEAQPADISETGDVAKGAIFGSSIFQGLSHLLHTCLVLGAVDARDKYLGTSAPVEEGSDSVNAASESKDQDAWISELESDYTDTTGGITIPDSSGEGQIDNIKRTNPNPQTRQQHPTSIPKHLHTLPTHLPPTSAEPLNSENLITKPQTSQTPTPKAAKPSGPRIQTVRAAHKPTIVESPVRRNSHQFTIMDSTEQPEEDDEDDDEEEDEAGEGCYFYYNDSETEKEDASAPLNRLGERGE